MREGAAELLVDHIPVLDGVRLHHHRICRHLLHSNEETLTAQQFVLNLVASSCISGFLPAL